MQKCPVCLIENENVQISSGFSGNDYGNIKSVNCPRCGRYKIYFNEFESLSDDTESYDVYFRSKISHWIRKNQRKKDMLLITKENIDNVKDVELPKAKDQADNLILWLGGLCKTPEEIQKKEAIEITAIIGAIDLQGVKYILEHLFSEGLITHSGTMHSLSLKMTFKGWNRYDELKRAGIESRRAFMAMEYGDPTLNSIFENHFKKAVSKAGFELFKLEDRPRAGIIDDHIRVEIRNSRFLLVDLTHRNNGAYWEAGFAEGLGKPVIYLCEKSVFEKEKGSRQD